MMGVRPNFIVVGSLKCGTSWLYNVLNKYDKVRMPYVKEINYFSEIDWEVKTNIFSRLFNNHWRNIFFRNMFKYHIPYLIRNKDIHNLIFYLKFVLTPRTLSFNLFFYKILFSNKYISGDITPSYMSINEKSLIAISNKLPETQLYILVRNPIHRIVSCFKMIILKEKKRSLETITRNEFLEYLNHPHTKAESDFARVIMLLKTHFPNKHRIIYYDNIKEDPQSVISMLNMDLNFTNELKELKTLNKVYNKGMDIELPKWMMEEIVKNQMINIDNLEGLIDYKFIQKWRNELYF